MIRQERDLTDHKIQLRGVDVTGRTIRETFDEGVKKQTHGDAFIVTSEEDGDKKVKVFNLQNFVEFQMIWRG